MVNGEWTMVNKSFSHCGNGYELWTISYEPSSDIRRTIFENKQYELRGMITVDRRRTTVHRRHPAQRLPDSTESPVKGCVRAVCRTCS